MRALGSIAIAASVLVSCGSAACSRREPPPVQPKLAEAPPAVSVATDSPVLLLAGAVSAPAVADAGALPEAPAASTVAGKVVLHTGDSMVGGNAGLTKALETKFKAEGARFISDYQTSVSIMTFDHSPRLRNLLAQHKPDIVILTLGANDVFVPFPQALTANVEAIAKRIAPRECYWMGPPTWKPDTGIVAIVRDHSAPCRFFDSSSLHLQRAGDGIHPTDKGGAEWADKFWRFFKAPAGPSLGLDGG